MNTFLHVPAWLAVAAHYSHKGRDWRMGARTIAEVIGVMSAALACRAFYAVGWSRGCRWCRLQWEDSIATRDRILARREP